jgi:molecular chaperone DnaK
MTKIIQRNTTIPTKKSEVFSTAADNQTSVEIHVLQGERELARDNRTLGRFHLAEIPPAPRGMPQVEVTFDIDANGIVHVSAKDLKTNKEQKIKIESSGALNDDDIEKMVKDAEAHADEDKKIKEVAKEFNELDQLVYTLDKSLQSAKNLDESIKSEIQSEIQGARDILHSNDLEKLRSAKQKLNEVLTKHSEALQKAAQEAASGDQAQASDEKTNDKSDEKIVDAEVVDIEDEKK